MDNGHKSPAPLSGPQSAQDGIAIVIEAVEAAMQRGGSGKKMLAIQHAHAHLYEAMWWLNAVDNMENLIEVARRAP